jgi:hypothetical protein
VFEGELEKLEVSLGNESCEPLRVEILGRRIVSSVRAQDAVRVWVIDRHTKEVTTQLFLVSATRVSTRLTETTLTVTDNLGRVVVVDLHRNCTIRNLRI